MARCKCQVSLLMILLALFLLATMGEGLGIPRRSQRTRNPGGQSSRNPGRSSSKPGQSSGKVPGVDYNTGTSGLAREAAGQAVRAVAEQAVGALANGVMNKLFNKDDDRRAPVVVIQPQPTAAPAKNGAASSGTAHGIITTIIPVVSGVLLLRQRSQ